MNKYSDESIFCVKYLAQQGYLSEDKLTEIASLLDEFDVDFNLVRVQKEDFFDELAKGLRNIWPAGEKDGKYSWRDSQQNIKKRLKILWNKRGFKDVPLDICLAVARKYVSQFQDSRKYMKTLKYFIMKQGEIIEKDGRIRYTDESLFADMIEANDFDPSDAQNEWEDMFNQNNLNEGVLI